MSHEEKINYLRIAASLCNYGFTNQQLDLFYSLYEAVIEKQGNNDLKEILEIESRVKAKHEAIAKSELLDKFSEKI